jgi:Uma2 family endonuclease
MLARSPERWTFDQYMAWEAEQDEKWEFVDGFPVRRSERWDTDPVTGMAGATLGHNRIVANLIVALRPRLRGSPCEAFATDLTVRSQTGNARFPDVVVNCGHAANDALIAPEPRALFEILSKSNRFRGQVRLIADYQAMASVQHFVFLEQTTPGLVMWTRTTNGWDRSELDGLDATLVLPAISTDLPLAEIYEGMGFEPA